MKDKTTNNDEKLIVEKTEKKSSTKKQKLVSCKKLPGIFKKTYNEKKFNKQIMNKLFIEKDKEDIKKLFSNTTDKKGNQVLKIDLTKSITKDELANFKSLAKQIKNNGTAIKFVPLFAVVIFIAAIGVSFTLFKNILISKAITSSLQGIFEAKTDIQKVDFRFFDSYLDIKGLEQANSNSPMKNLFQIDDIHVDFNLTDLLRGKVHIEKIAVEGVALDTDRTKSGELAFKPLKAVEEKIEQSNIEEKSNKIKEECSKKLLEMFENYNPEKMLESLQNELQSPAVAIDISNDIQTKITKWQEKPAQLKKEIDDFSSSVNSVIKTNWGGINDVNKLKNALTTVSKAIEQGDKLKTDIEKQSKELQKDVNSVNEYSSKLKTAINADSKLVENKIYEMKNLFSPNGIKTMMNDAIQSILYSYTGKYYPYVKKGVDAAQNIIQNSATKDKKDKTEDKKKEKETKKQVKRLAGRTVYYENDTIPKLLIENMVASGYEYGTDKLLFKGEAFEISSNQDIRNKPSTIKADFNIQDKPNNCDIIIDARKNNNDSLIKANYNGKGYPISADAEIFKFSSTSDINAKLSADKKGNFNIGGSLDMKLSEMKGTEFEPERVCKLYNNALSNVKNLSIGFNIKFSQSNGISIEIENPEKLANQLTQPIVAALSNEINVIANESKANITKVLSEKTGIATDKLNQFTNIQSAINAEKNNADNLQKQLEKKKQEINKQIQNSAKNAASSLLNSLF